MSTKETDKFFQKAYQMEDENDVASHIMRHIFQLKEARDHEAIQDIMNLFDFHQFDSPLVIMTALRICAVRETFNEVHQLIVTGGEKTRLDNWDEFFQRGLARLKELDVDDLPGLIVGLA